MSLDAEQHENGVKLPDLSDVRFLVFREVVDEESIYNPVDNEGNYEGAFQINFHAHREGYLQLAKFFRHWRKQTSAEIPVFTSIWSLF